MMPVIKNKGGVILDASAPIEPSSERAAEGAPAAGDDDGSGPRTAEPAASGPGLEAGSNPPVS